MFRILCLISIVFVVLTLYCCAVVSSRSGKLPMVYERDNLTGQTRINAAENAAAYESKRAQEQETPGDG